MKQKRKFMKSLIRPIFNALIGLIMVLSAAIGTVGYFVFADALKEQYAFSEYRTLRKRRVNMFYMPSSRSCGKIISIYL